MFRQLTALVLIPLLFASSLSKTMVLAGFRMNRSYIAAELCENRDKPQLHCQGKCYLKKKLQLAEQKEKEQELKKQHTPDSFIVQHLTVSFWAEFKIIVDTPYNASQTSEFDQRLLRPPAAGYSFFAQSI